MGQKSRVIRVPSLGLGVSVMANDSEFGLWFVQAAEGTILNHLMGLAPVDWPSRYVERLVGNAKTELAEAHDFGMLFVDYDNSAFGGITASYRLYGRATLFCLVFR